MFGTSKIDEELECLHLTVKTLMNVQKLLLEEQGRIHKNNDILLERIKGLEKAVQKDNPLIDTNGFNYGSLFRIAEVMVEEDLTEEPSKIRIILQPLRPGVDILVRKGEE